MVSDANYRRVFINSTIEFCYQYNFDGIDIDWEYPVLPDRGGNETDKANFVLLLQEFRTIINNVAKPRGRKLSLSVAVGVGEDTVSRAYDIPGIANEVDWIGLMAYDLHGPWDGVTNYHTAICGDTYDKFTIDYSLNLWLTGGAKPRQMVLGIAFYGKSFNLSSNLPAGPGTNAPNGAASGGSISNEAGTLIYPEILDMYALGYHNYTKKKATYAQLANVWVSYDDEESVAEKVQYAKVKKLGGVLMWALDQDNYVTSPKYPLQNAIVKAVDYVVPTPGPSTLEPIEPPLDRDDLCANAKCDTIRRVVGYYASWSRDLRRNKYDVEYLYSRIY